MANQGPDFQLYYRLGAKGSSLRWKSGAARKLVSKSKCYPVRLGRNKEKVKESGMVVKMKVAA